MEPVEGSIRGKPIKNDPFYFVSLDEIFPFVGFSDTFSSNGMALRSAIRQDIYDTTPQYQGLSEKSKAMLLMPESSLQGSWYHDPNKVVEEEEVEPHRMKRTTRVLEKYLNNNTTTTTTARPPTGNE
mmetsp:Transcript_4685/g.7181  ORF Transcript_4685/g.7181 Transcript_4685/m.7181 type:complete len:127 (-) Transcript_4685:372-752(-)